MMLGYNLSGNVLVFLNIVIFCDVFKKKQSSCRMCAVFVVQLNVAVFCFANL